MKIGNWDSSKDQVLIIAELSANHNQKFAIAIDTIKAAKRAGADAVKFQTYTPDTITLDSAKEYFKINQGTLWDGKYLYDLYKEAHTPWEWHEELFRVAKEEGLICFSSPFDKTAIDLLESFDSPAYKIASFEITDIPLIEYAASKGKSIIISTGIATESEIWDAVNASRDQGNDQIIILKCTSTYPALVEEANLKTMVDFKEKFNVEYGLSDHTLGNEVPITAAVLGARIIEKHFILNKNIGGPDADFSLDESEFKSMVESVRNACRSLGKVDYKLNDSKLKSRNFMRSLFITDIIKKGEKFSGSNIRSIRPGYGLPPRYFNDVIGKIASRDLERGEPLRIEDVEDLDIIEEI